MQSFYWSKSNNSTLGLANFHLPPLVDPLPISSPHISHYVWHSWAMTSNLALVVKTLKSTTKARSILFVSTILCCFFYFTCRTHKTKLDWRFFVIMWLSYLDHRGSCTNCSLNNLIDHNFKPPCTNKHSPNGAQLWINDFALQYILMSLLSFQGTSSLIMQLYAI
jgi:hypothetical protein